MERTLTLFGHEMTGVIFRLIWTSWILRLLGEQAGSLFYLVKQSKALSQLEPFSFFVVLHNFSREN